MSLVVSVLEAAADLLEGVSSTTPRKGRKAVREQLEGVESLAESVDVEWCRGLGECSEEELMRLGSAMVGVTEACGAGVAAAVESGGAMGAVRELLRTTLPEAARPEDRASLLDLATQLDSATADSNQNPDSTKELPR